MCGAAAAALHCQACTATCSRFLPCYKPSLFSIALLPRSEERRMAAAQQQQRRAAEAEAAAAQRARKGKAPLQALPPGEEALDEEMADADDSEM